MPGKGRPFQKGQSGNPNGRAKQDISLVELAKSYTKEAVETLATIMRKADAPETARASAASALLDRGHGRPVQFSTGDEEAFKRALEMSDDELASIATRGSPGTSTPSGNPKIVH